MKVAFSFKYLEMITSSAVLGIMRSFFSFTMSQNFLLETSLRIVVVQILIININCCQLMQQDQNNVESKQRYLIVVFGPPASGKSTFAKQLHESYQQYCRINELKQESLMISADCLEEFLKNHDVSNLQRQFQNRKDIEYVMNLRLRRSKFIEENWKQSRRIVKQNLPIWLKNNRLIIVEDDMLLKSQRKHFRHIAEQEKCLYLEIFIDNSIQQCLKNLKERQITEQQQYRLSLQKFEEAFNKFEIDENPYLMKLLPDSKPKWTQIAQTTKIVTINHPELQQKQPAPIQNKQKDDVQVKIRKFVSEIISNKELHKKYFPNAETQKIASLVGSIKKRYTCKIKTFQGFLQFFKNETDSFNRNVLKSKDD